METIGHLTRKAALYALCGVILFSPLPFGSTDNKILAIWSVLLGLIASLNCVGTISRLDKLFLGTFAIVSLNWAAIILAQTLPISAVTKPLAYPIWKETSLIFGFDIQDYLTATRNQPLLTAGSEIVCALSLLCGYLVGRSRSGARTLLKVFAYSGLAYAVYGVLSFVLAPDYVLGFEKIAYRNVLTSTFINPNTACVYFGVCSISWALLLAESIKNRLYRANIGAREFFLRPSRQVSTHSIFLVIVLSAALMTGSRFGSVVSLFGLLGASLTYYCLFRGNWSAVIKGAVIASFAAAGLFEALGGRVNQRFDVNGLSDEGRFYAYASTIHIVQAHPWLGTGLGTFPWVFPAYRSDLISIVGIWDRAHNTALELASEMGVPFLLVVVAIWITILFVLARGIASRRRDQILPIFSFWASLVALLHSQLDFSLQIPGFSISILTFAGIGIAQSTPSPSLA